MNSIERPGRAIWKWFHRFIRMNRDDYKEIGKSRSSDIGVFAGIFTIDKFVEIEEKSQKHIPTEKSICKSRAITLGHQMAEIHSCLPRKSSQCNLYQRFFIQNISQYRLRLFRPFNGCGRGFAIRSHVIHARHITETFRVRLSRIRRPLRHLWQRGDCENSRNRSR